MQYVVIAQIGKRWIEIMKVAGSTQVVANNLLYVQFLRVRSLFPPSYLLGI